eukprot:282601-Chlamydomonas_euryale.AAC.1
MLSGRLAKTWVYRHESQVLGRTRNRLPHLRPPFGHSIPSLPPLPPYPCPPTIHTHTHTYLLRAPQVMKKKPKKKDGKPQIKMEKVESFFNFFSPPEVPEEDDDVDEETMEELQAIIEADYEVRRCGAWVSGLCGDAAA